MTRTTVRAVRVQAYVRIGSRTIRSTRFIAMIPAVFICKLTTLLSIAPAPSPPFLRPRSSSPPFQPRVLVRPQYRYLESARISLRDQLQTQQKKAGSVLSKGVPHQASNFYKWKQYINTLQRLCQSDSLWNALNKKFVSTTFSDINRCSIQTLKDNASE